MNRRSGMFRATAALCAATLLSAACVTWTPVSEPLPDVLTRTQHIRVTTADSVRFQLEGNARDAVRVEGETLIGPLGQGIVSILIADIAHVEAAIQSTGRRTAIFAGAVVLIGTALLLLMSGVEAGDRP